MNSIEKICANIKKLTKEDFDEVRIKLTLQKIASRDKHCANITHVRKGLARNTRIFKKLRELYDEIKD